MVFAASLSLAGIAAAMACVGDDPEPARSGSTRDAGATDTGPVTTNDATTGTDAGDDAPSRACESVLPPPGVTDFLCADFDGDDFAEGWSSVVKTDGAVLESTDTFYTSAPNGLLAKAIADAATTGGQLLWEKGGAKSVTEVSLDFRFNPTSGGIILPDDGSIELARVGTDKATFELHYTDGSNLQDLPMPYTGYFVRRTISAGAAALTNDVIGTGPANDTWTRIKMIYQPESGHVSLTYNETVTLFTETDGMFAATSTVARARIGSAASYDKIGSPQPARFDDVLVAAKRAQ
jgi:hypothetical protein